MGVITSTHQHIMKEAERMHQLAGSTNESSRQIRNQLSIVGKRQTSQSSMTVKILRTYSGMENLSDKEGETVILTLKRFAALAFKAYQLQKQHTSKVKQAA